MLIFNEHIKSSASVADRVTLLALRPDDLRLVLAATAFVLGTAVHANAILLLPLHPNLFRKVGAASDRRRDFLATFAGSDELSNCLSTVFGDRGPAATIR